MTRFATVAVLAAVLVAAVIHFAGRVETRAPQPRGAAPEARAVSLPVAAPAAVAATTQPVVSSPASSSVPCEGIREAVSAKDGARLDESLDRLLAWVGGDVQRALEVVAMMSRETDAMMLDTVADALSQNARLGDARELLEAFLGMALRDALPARRIAALTFLEERPRDEALEAQFLSIALGDADSEVRTAAVCALRRQVDLVPAARARLDATLLRATVSTDEMVRATAVEALSMREADASQVERLLRDDRDAHVRAAAAEKLADAGTQALAALEESYTRDADDHVRCMALVALVRAGGAEALPALRRVAGLHPTLDAMVDRLSAGLAAGKTDMNALLDDATAIDEVTAPGQK